MDYMVVRIQARIYVTRRFSASKIKVFCMDFFTLATPENILRGKIMLLIQSSLLYRSLLCL